MIPDFFLWKYDCRISSYEFKSHNTHCGQHCQDFITCTCFLSHEPNVSKHSQLSRGMCSQLSLDVLWTSDSRRLLRYKAHKNIEIQKTKFMIWVWTQGYISTSLTITNTKTEKVQSYYLFWAFVGGYFEQSHHKKNKNKSKNKTLLANQIKYC